MSTTNDQTRTPPDLHIPPSTHTVDVSIINTTSTIREAKTTDFFGPDIKGHDWLAAPVFSFLIQRHGPDGTRSLLFDLGIPPDWCNSSPTLVSHLKSIKPTWTLDTKKSVLEILKDENIDTSTIEAIIWSHHHFDHTGDVSSFPPSTHLIVGPGVTEGLLPGYPDNPNSTLLKSDYANRNLIELDFTSPSGTKNTSNTYPTLQIGKLNVIDYFSDGSFYLLNTPGHAIGHICGLARVTAQKDAFILLAGDAFHHVGELRLSHWLTIPETLNSSYEPLDSPQKDQSTNIDGHLFDKLLPQAELGEENGCLGSFYRPSGSCACHALSKEGGTEEENPKWHHDPNETARTLAELQEFDAQDNIFVMAAHDESLLDVVDFFPAGKLNDFYQKGWAGKAKWRFLADFVGGIDGISEDFKRGVTRRDWGPLVV